MSSKKLFYLSLAVFVGIVAYQVYLKATEKEVVPLTKSWEKAVPHQQVPKGLASLSAKQCGACHPDAVADRGADTGGAGHWRLPPLTN